MQHQETHMALLPGKPHLPGEEPSLDMLMEDRGELRRSIGQESKTGQRRRHQQCLDLAEDVPGQGAGYLECLAAF